MIRKLRMKFVFTTIALMVSVFGVIFYVNYLYNRYWDERYILQTLNWMSEYHVMERSLKPWEAEQIFDGINVYFLLLSKEGEVLYQIDSEGDETLRVPDGLIQSVLDSDESDFKMRKYIYVVSRDYDEGEIGVYYANISYESWTRKQLVELVVIIVASITLLIFVSFILSQFVVSPAKKALEREKQFIADASHELKTPLTAISINAQVLKQQGVENQHLDYILTESDRMSRLIQRLLTLSRMESGEIAVEHARVSVSHCCEEILLMMESVAYERGLHLEYEIAPECDCMGNEDELRQLFLILVDNAIKYTLRNGKITCRLTRNKNSLIFEIKNTTESVSEEVVEHLFDRFYRKNEARNNESGTQSFGLGLAIAKSIVTGHKGKIEADGGEDWLRIRVILTCIKASSSPVNQNRGITK